MAVQTLLDEISSKIKLCKEHYSIDEPAPYIYRFEQSPHQKTIRLTIMGVTHGSEVNGLSVLNGVLDYLIQAAKSPESAGITKPNFNFCLIAANYRAALQQKRYLESDLNRAFGVEKPKTMEHLRAKEISEHALDQTELLVDLHQTILPTQQPFFIFPFSKKGVQLANKICPQTSIVTHWNGGFSKDGMCTDEYTNKKQGIGISLETGQCGFDPKQAVYGSSRMIDLIRKLNEPEFKFSELETMENKFYTWEHIEPYPKHHVKLMGGLSNFQTLNEGQKIGVISHQNREDSLVVPTGGMLMFPKYVSPDQVPPAELYRIAKEISYQELPQMK